MLWRDYYALARSAAANGVVMKKMIFGLIALFCMAVTSVSAVTVKCYLNDECISEKNMALNGAQCAHLCNQVTQNGFVNSLTATAAMFIRRVDDIANNQARYNAVVNEVQALGRPITTVVFDLNAEVDEAEVDRIKGLLDLEMDLD